MEANKTLREILENLGETYADDTVGGRNGIEIRFDDQPRISEDGTAIYVNPDFAGMLDLDLSPANEFRLVRDTLNHECAHERWSNLRGKREFVAKYDDYGRLAGQVYNILEDAYIDSRRLGEYPGLRKAHAFFAESQIDRDVVEDTRGVADALTLCVHQLALSGRVEGIRDADDEVREFAAWVRPRIRRVRDTHDVHARESIAAEVTEHIIDLLPPNPDLDALDDLLDDIADEDDLKPEDVENEPASDADAGDAPTDDLPDLDQDENDDDETAENGASEDANGDEDAQDDDTQEDVGDAQSDENEDDADSSSSSSDTSENANDEDKNDDAGGNDNENSNDLDDELDELDDLDERGENPEWHDADDDYEEPSESDKRRAERIQEDALVDDTPLGTRKKERDARIRDKPHLDDISIPHDEVRDEVEDDGLADDIRRAFERFATEDITRNDTHGDALDMRAATRHKAGDYSEQRVYENTYTAASGGRTVAVTLDASSSMSGERMREAKKALAALAEATDAIGDKFLATGYTTPRGSTVGLNAPLITAPNETFDYEHLDAVGCEGMTPTPPAIADIADLLRDARGKELVLICISDGIPNRALDGSKVSKDEAREQTRSKVEELRNEDIRVIGMNIAGEGKEPSFAHMFGENGYITTDSETLVDDLVGVYEEQLDVRRPAF
jgi:hypothetical protein